MISAKGEDLSVLGFPVMRYENLQYQQMTK